MNRTDNSERFMTRFNVMRKVFHPNYLLSDDNSMLGSLKLSMPMIKESQTLCTVSQEPNVGQFVTDKHEKQDHNQTEMEPATGKNDTQDHSETKMESATGKHWNQDPNQTEIETKDTYSRLEVPEFSDEQTEFKSFSKSDLRLDIASCHDRIYVRKAISTISIENSVWNKKSLSTQRIKNMMHSMNILEKCGTQNNDNNTSDTYSLSLKIGRNSKFPNSKSDFDYISVISPCDDTHGDYSHTKETRSFVSEIEKFKSLRTQISIDESTEPDSPCSTTPFIMPAKKQPAVVTNKSFKYSEVSFNDESLLRKILS